MTESPQTPGRETPPPPPPGAQPPATTGGTGGVSYAARLDVERKPQYDKLTTGLRYFLLIPHAIWVGLLGFAAGVAAIVAVVQCLFNGGQWPRGTFDFVYRVQRYGVNVNAYALLLRDEFPSFNLDEQDQYPGTRYELDYPEGGVTSWRPLAQLLLLYIPAGIFSAVVGMVAGIIAFIAWFAILFTGEFPPGMFEFARNAMRVQARTTAYQLGLTEEYPPFELK